MKRQDEFLRVELCPVLAARPGNQRLSAVSQRASERTGESTQCFLIEYDESASAVSSGRVGGLPEQSGNYGVCEPRHRSNGYLG
jgi:hypothetical protein